MGAWGTGVTESDSALDLMAEFEANVDENSIPEILRFIEVNAHMIERDDVSPAMIAAHALMTAGKFIPEVVKVQVVIEYDMLKKSASTAGWDDPAERAKSLADFYDDVMQYRLGDDYQDPDRGLFETIFEKDV